MVCRRLKDSNEESAIGFVFFDAAPNESIKIEIALVGHRNATVQIAELHIHPQLGAVVAGRAISQ